MAHENITSTENEGSDLIKVHAIDLLENSLNLFKDKKIGLKKIAQKTGIHERTLDRIIKNENKPNYQTLLKIYRYCLNEYRDVELLKLLPDEIKSYLEKYISKPEVENSISNYNVDKLLQENSIASQLYVLAGTGAISKDHIQNLFGQYGIKILLEMKNEKILQEIDNNVFILGANQAQFTPETLLKAGVTMSQNYFNCEAASLLSQNHISFLADNLSEEEYWQFLKIDQEAHLRKLEIMNSRKNVTGKIRAFSFMATDKIILQDYQ